MSKKNKNVKNNKMGIKEANSNNTTNTQKEVQDMNETTNVQEVNTMDNIQNIINESVEAPAITHEVPEEAAPATAQTQKEMTNEEKTAYLLEMMRYGSFIKKGEEFKHLIAGCDYWYTQHKDGHQYDDFGDVVMYNHEKAMENHGCTIYASSLEMMIIKAGYGRLFKQEELNDEQKQRIIKVTEWLLHNDFIKVAKYKDADGNTYVTEASVIKTKYIGTDDFGHKQYEKLPDYNNQPNCVPFTYAVTDRVPFNKKRDKRNEWGNNKVQGNNKAQAPQDKTQDSQQTLDANKIAAAKLLEVAKTLNDTASIKAVMEQALTLLQ